MKTQHRYPKAVLARTVALGIGSALALTACATSAPPAGGEDAGPIATLAVEVHHDFITGVSGAGINVLDQCEPPIEDPSWQLVPYTDLQQLAFREASLGSTDNDLFFLLDSWASPRLTNLLEPLSGYQEADPIEEFEGISPDLFAPYQRDGEFYGVPIRTTTVVLMYDDQRVTEVPTTIEELVDTATSLAGTNADGQPTYGIRFSSVDDLVSWARAFGGDLITSDYEIAFTEEPTIRALEALKELYDAKAIPENFASLTADDWLRMEQQGQVAMTLRGSTYYGNLDDPEVSRIAGHVGVTTFPSSEDIGGAVDVPAATWYMSIPANATNKQGAWDFIQCVSSVQSTIDMALNNNTPVRPSAFEAPEVAEATVPALGAAQAAVLEVARPGLPGFDGQVEAVAILQEAMVAAITGQQSPEDAMKAAAEQIAPLLEQD
ncbi:extracellular solute-binding protein [soil metagenome]